MKNHFSIFLDVMSNVIIACIKDSFFDLEDFNDIILNFEYSGNDNNNKPQILKKKPLNSLRGKQIAYEMLTLLRLLPLMVGHLILRENTVWGVYIKLLQIVEMLCADEFSIQICSCYKMRLILSFKDMLMFFKMYL